jgi:hypothetical protein
MRLKTELYGKEQEDIKVELFALLRLDKNHSIALYELQKDTEKQQKIMNLLPQIRKFFSVGSTNVFVTPERMERPWLSIVKHMLKSDYEIFSKSVKFKKDEELISTIRYIFRKK